MFSDLRRRRESFQLLIVSASLFSIWLMGEGLAIELLANRPLGPFSTWQAIFDASGGLETLARCLPWALVAWGAVLGVTTQRVFAHDEVSRGQLAEVDGVADLRTDELLHVSRTRKASLNAVEAKYFIDTIAEPRLHFKRIAERIEPSSRSMLVTSSVTLDLPSVETVPIALVPVAVVKRGVLLNALQVSDGNGRRVSTVPQEEAIVYALAAMRAVMKAYGDTVARKYQAPREVPGVASKISLETLLAQVLASFGGPNEPQSQLTEIGRIERQDLVHLVLKTLGKGAATYLDVFSHSLDYYFVCALLTRDESAAARGTDRTRFTVTHRALVSPGGISKRQAFAAFRDGRKIVAQYTFPLAFGWNSSGRISRVSRCGGFARSPALFAICWVSARRRLSFPSSPPLAVSRITLKSRGTELVCRA